jgi:MFS family permease
MLFSVLRRPAFASLWLGALVSLTGDWVLLTGLPLVVYRLTGSTFALGATAIAAALPRLLVGSVAGVFVDRWDRRRTMLACNILLGLALLPLLLVTSADSLWLVGPVLLLESSLAQFYKPAEGALLPHLLPADDLATANALNGLSLNLARLCGPPLGALLAGSVGLKGLALFDATSFLLAAASVGFIRLVNVHGETKLAPTQPLSVVREWLEGLHLVRSERSPRTLAAFLAITGLGEGIMGTLMVPFATRVMHGTELTFGALVSAQAVGGLIGSAATAQLGGRVRPGRLLGAGAVLLGVVDLLIFYAPLLTPFPLLSVGLMALVGLPAAVIMPSYYTLIQTHVCDRHRGRVLGTGLATVALTGMAGMLLAGWLGDSVGIVPLLTVQSAGYVCAGCVALWQLD